MYLTLHQRTHIQHHLSPSLHSHDPSAIPRSYFNTASSLMSRIDARQRSSKLFLFIQESRLKCGELFPTHTTNESSDIRIAYPIVRAQK
jgi:hypothetical protein